MPCYHPIRAFRPEPGSACRKLIFSKLELAHLEPIKVPCGQCIGCRLERSRQWALRCVHEASLYERNSFITLTYNPQNLPKSTSLEKADFQKFMKRLRKRFGDGIRYYHCGEYGEQCATCDLSRKRCLEEGQFVLGPHPFLSVVGRPHYHACLFNHHFDDRRLWQVRQGVKLFTSETLTNIWGKGHCTVGDVTFESAAYVARYITKKVTGVRADSHYERLDKRTGELRAILPEYTTMSRGGRYDSLGGIGKPWLKKFMTDVYPHDRVVLQKKDSVLVLRPPKYYDAIFELEDSETMEDIKFRRLQVAKDSVGKGPSLEMRERHQQLRYQKLKRGYENEEGFCSSRFKG